LLVCGCADFLDNLAEGVHRFTHGWFVLTILQFLDLIHGCLDLCFKLRRTFSPSSLKTFSAP